jgi:hypothetical protein
LVYFRSRKVGCCLTVIAVTKLSVSFIAFLLRRFSLKAVGQQATAGL